MKVKKYLLCSLVFIFTIVLATGCTKKEALSPQQFSEVMENQKFTVTEVTDNYTEISDIERVFVAINQEGTIKIEYYQFNSKDKSKEFFEKTENKFRDSDSKKSQYQTTSFGNYNFYSLTTDESYKFVSRIDKTVILTDSDRGHKERIKEIISKLKY